jgi:hypothetical protein
VVEGGRAVEKPGGAFQVTRAKQIGNFQDFCNECGNCDVFCPEDLGPYIEKPRFFGSREAFDALPERDGFLVHRDGPLDHGLLRHRGRRYEVQVDRRAGRARFTDGHLAVEIEHAARRPVAVDVRPGTPEGHHLDFSAYLNLAVVLDGVLDTSRANPVNAAVVS